MGRMPLRHNTTRQLSTLSLSLLLIKVRVNKSVKLPEFVSSILKPNKGILEKNKQENKRGRAHAHLVSQRSQYLDTILECLFKTPSSAMLIGYFETTKKNKPELFRDPIFAYKYCFFFFFPLSPCSNPPILLFYTE